MHIENNNNVNFGAYFKNNKAFKKALSLTNSCHVNKSLVDEFLHETKNYEIEIIESEYFSRKNCYTLFNNTVGLHTNVQVKTDECTLNKLLEGAIELCRCAPLYKSKEMLYKKLTNQK